MAAEPDVTPDDPLAQLEAAARPYLANGVPPHWSPLPRAARLGALAFDVALAAAATLAFLAPAALVIRRLPWPYAEMVAMFLIVLAPLAYATLEVFDNASPGKRWVGGQIRAIDSTGGRERGRRWARVVLRSWPLLLILCAQSAEMLAPRGTFGWSRWTPFDEPGMWVIGALPLALLVQILGALLTFGPLGQTWYDRVTRTAVLHPGVPRRRARGFEPVLVAPIAPSDLTGATCPPDVGTPASRVPPVPTTTPL